jgi:hypothetical protein
VCIPSSGSKFRRGVLHLAWLQWIGEFRVYSIDFLS